MNTNLSFSHSVPIALLTNLAGPDPLLIFLGVLCVPILLWILFRKRDVGFTELAKQQGRKVSRIKFIPSFFHSQRYSGKGFIEVKKDSIIVFGRRKWPFGKKVIGFIVVAFLLAVIGHVIGLMGAFILSSFIFRSRVEDQYSFNRIQSITRETPVQYVLNFNKAEGDKQFKIVFESKEFNQAYEDILAQLRPLNTASEIKPEVVAAEQKDAAINLENINSAGTHPAVKSSQLLAISEIEKRVSKGDLNL